MGRPSFRTMLHFRVITVALALFVAKSSQVGISTARTNLSYIVNTDKCKMPNFHPFNEDTIPISIREDYVSCTSRDLLTFVTKDPTSNRAKLWLNRQSLPQYQSKFMDAIVCKYANITRNGTVDHPDTGIAISEEIEFEESVDIFGAVIVKCYNNFTDGLVYENTHYPVVFTPEIVQKLPPDNHPKRPLSVLFVVIDSISRLNLIRTMPKTRNFLINNNFTEFEGYNKVDDNTYPNAMAFLTGLNLAQAHKECKAAVLNGLDNCDMIWYDFRKFGYATAYAEDHAKIGTFNYEKSGFTKPPTDYYFRPYVEGSETLRNVIKDGMPYCVGPETSGERILNSAKDFSSTFKKIPNFGVFWMNTFSHNYINAPYGMDEKVLNFFTDLKWQGVFDETMIVFLSDHGIRFGEIRLTKTGWFEERLPFNLISVPKWFQDENPQEYRNFLENKNKLTTPYDLFMTLQHILKLSAFSYDVKKSQGCPKCQSLFEKLPTSRSCAESGIPPIWCTCIGHLRPLDNSNQLVQNAVKIVINKFNSFLSDSMCLPYTSARIEVGGISESVNFNDSRTLFMVLKTNPSATYLVTVIFKSNQITESSEFSMDRQGYYWAQTRCAVTKYQKMYCVCPFNKHDLQ